MKGKMVFIRIVYIFGIVADAVMSVVLSFPGLFIKFNNLNAESSPAFVYATLNAAPLMLGWTLVLIWGILKPVERSGMLLCLIPLLLFYMTANIIGMTSGVCPVENTIFLLANQTVLVIMCTLGYIFARQIKKAEQKNAG